MPQKAFIIHGHFYQPERQNPLTEMLPFEEGAHPFQNWNERIHHDCYLPKAKEDNFRKMSFNIGPTLHSWLESAHPETSNQVLIQDKMNLLSYGVSSAMAQPFHHAILPLASENDKKTEIHWGIEDFIFRYGHKPLGLWLPETAVDMETFNILANNGILYTILAPWQAANQNLNHVPYKINLDNGKSIIVFSIIRR